jgi:Asp-tRNA(Asn)/Glu-tRNA(Gln) amidotransferase A subunit family amidase
VLQCTLQVARRILMGTYALSSGYYEAYYKRAQQARPPFGHLPLCGWPAPTDIVVLSLAWPGFR